ncbi:MAG TPA: hypothetical protein VKV19_06070 [Ktedonobacteraceae bacterium]|nr:hypothetical protein [Ktedonobacteraceae bacterium]
MSMQEFEQEAQGQSGQSAYRADYTESYEAGQQKIQPFEGQRQSNAMHIVAIVLSSIGFAFSIMGVVGSSIVLQWAQSGVFPTEFTVGGKLGLASSIVAMLIFIAIFVVAIISLALRAIRRRGFGRFPSRRRSMGNLGNLGW